MIDEGISMFVNNSLLNANPPVPYGGGYFQEMVPANPTYPFWVFHGISKVRNTGLLFARGLVKRRIQIDVFGDPAQGGSDAILLAGTIDKILNGFSGNLPDPDSTFVSSCFNDDELDPDGVDPSVRSYERKLQYEVNYCEQS